MDLSNIAEIELTYKRHPNSANNPKISTSEDAYNVLIRNWNENKIDFLEEAKVILLSRSNRVLGISNISSGGVSCTVVDPRMVLVTALKANASAIVLAHNHPSGSLQPSNTDRIMTERLINASEILGISMFDHLIVANEGYYSFTDDTVYMKRSYPNYTSFEAQFPF